MELIPDGACIFTECYNTGNITGNGNYVGGLVGETNPRENAVLRIAITVAKLVGTTIQRESSAALVRSTAVKSCHNEGKITGNDYAAGIFGRSSSGGTAVEECYNLSGVKVPNMQQGIFGYSNSTDTTVKDCYNLGVLMALNTWRVFGYSNSAYTTVKDSTTGVI